MLNIQYYIDAFFSSYFGAIIILILGIIKTYKSWKNEEKNYSYAMIPTFMKGWVAGLGLIALGIIMLVYKLLGKL